MVAHGLQLLNHLYTRSLDAAGGDVFGRVRVDVGDESGERRTTIGAGGRVNNLVALCQKEERRKR
jgi:hypothetical protein